VARSVARGRAGASGTARVQAGAARVTRLRRWRCGGEASVVASAGGATLGSGDAIRGAVAGRRAVVSPDTAARRGAGGIPAGQSTARLSAGLCAAAGVSAAGRCAR
jgi:hypothetical protein